jgi:hypothetical protein
MRCATKPYFINEHLVIIVIVFLFLETSMGVFKIRIGLGLLLLIQNDLNRFRLCYEIKTNLLIF